MDDGVLDGLKVGFSGGANVGIIDSLLEGVALGVVDGWLLGAELGFKLGKVEGTTVGAFFEDLELRDAFEDLVDLELLELVWLRGVKDLNIATLFWGT